VKGTSPGVPVDREMVGRRAARVGRRAAGAAVQAVRLTAKPMMRNATLFRKPPRLIRGK
jgi:hypothetical protein